MLESDMLDVPASDVPAVPATPGMPPTPADEVVEAKEIVPEGSAAKPGETILSFFTLGGLDKALVASQYTAERELLILLEIAEDTCTDAMVRLGALRMIRENLRESMVLSGQLQQVTARQLRVTADGSVQSAQLEGTLLRPPETPTQRMLERARQIEAVLDLNLESPESPEPPESPEAPEIPEIPETPRTPETPEASQTEVSHATESETDRAEPETDRAEPETESDAAVEVVPNGPSGVKPSRSRPERDLGGGGVCASAQREARRARRRAADARAAAAEGAGTEGAGTEGGSAEGGSAEGGSREGSAGDRG